KTAVNPAFANRLNARALILDTQRQPTKNIIELTRHFRFSFRPTYGGGYRLELASHFHVRREDRHSQLVAALIGRLLRHLILKHCREESIFEVARVKANATDHLATF